MPLTTRRRWEGLDTPRKADEMIAEQIARGVALGRSRRDVAEALRWQMLDIVRGFMNNPKNEADKQTRRSMMLTYRAARLAHDMAREAK